MTIEIVETDRMRRATDDELRARLANHVGRREVMTVDFPEVGYEVAMRPATGAEFRSYLAETTQPNSATRLSLVMACLLFPDASTFNGLGDSLPGITSICFKEIDDAAAPADLDTFDLTDASAHRLHRMAPGVVQEALKVHRVTMGVTFSKSPIGETQFILRPPPRATYDDFEDAKDMAGVVPAADRAMYDCIIGLPHAEIAALIETHPGLPVLLYRDLRNMACPPIVDGARRKKARRVV
jgi:hypothetical protein